MAVSSREPPFWAHLSLKRRDHAKEVYSGLLECRGAPAIPGVDPYQWIMKGFKIVKEPAAAGRRDGQKPEKFLVSWGSSMAGEQKINLP